MAFDKSLDKELFGETISFEVTRLRVSVYSYNDGTPKLQISRENLDQNTAEWRWSKMGRLVKEEVDSILPLIQKALEHL
ncbi:hypothetical protein GOV10_01540 [Candidatus Woesearchaeota archaeon]|nr:hypothetical protein [Candidatus Woesearchaeota archaeon]